jgi:hypothetical protein
MEGLSHVKNCLCAAIFTDSNELGESPEHAAVMECDMEISVCRDRDGHHLP